MRELSVAEQRYRAVLEVIAEGRTVGEVWPPCAGDPPDAGGASYLITRILRVGGAEVVGRRE
jgi:hypothetical protein